MLYWVMCNCNALFVSEFETVQEDLDSLLKRHRLHLDHPLEFDLIKSLVVKDAKNRLSLDEAIIHPALWDRGQLRQVVMDVVRLHCFPFSFFCFHTIQVTSYQQDQRFGRDTFHLLVNSPDDWRSRWKNGNLPEFNVAQRGHIKPRTVNWLRNDVLSLFEYTRDILIHYNSSNAPLLMGEYNPNTDLVDRFLQKWTAAFPNELLQLIKSARIAGLVVNWTPSSGITLSLPAH